MCTLVAIALSVAEFAIAIADRDAISQAQIGDRGTNRARLFLEVDDEIGKQWLQDRRDARRRRTTTFVADDLDRR